MGTKIVRFKQEDQINWGVAINDQEYALIDGEFSSTNELLESGQEKIQAAAKKQVNLVNASDVELLSPITWPSKVVCQGANYSTHRAEAGLEAARPPFNLMFGKDISSLSGANANIVRPNHVELLDYEIELGLVIGKEINGAEQVTEEKLGNYICGLVIVNDVSARDVQLLEGQWLKGKSYRTFGPTGPYLYLLDQDEISQINHLKLELSVNGEIRQAASTEQLLFKPAETLTELSGIMDLKVGDLIITGTTGGVALNLTKELMSTVSNSSIPFSEKQEALLKSQKETNRYLNDGDIITCSIKSESGSIDLGEQSNKVISEKVVMKTF
ncbi:fumarylacetoacetate hydrolase family protein [Rummeliibacillus sp. JY-2-4R]